MPGGGTGFVDLEGCEAGKGTDWEAEPEWEEACCEAGSLVLIHGENTFFPLRLVLPAPLDFYLEPTHAPHGHFGDTVDLTTSSF